MTGWVALLLATLFLAYANGANDNFKGVATLFGSGTTSYRKALVWATCATLAGSGLALVVAHGLVAKFSGRGLVPDEVAASGSFLTAVAMGASLTVILATLLGFPVSTTHGLMGALVGAGLMVPGAPVNFAALGKTFVLPLILSPVLAVGVSAALYCILRSARLYLGVTEEMCVCVGATETVIPVPQPSSVLVFAAVPSGITVGTEATCHRRYAGRLFGLNAQQTLNGFHFLTAGAVCLARGLNDTPKILALMLGTTAISPSMGLVVIAVVMAVGGILNARKVAETMSRKITPMNHGQGFTANLVTAVLVALASVWGLPVSTTHVSVGALFGIGLVQRQAAMKVISQILLSWALTLPVAGLLAMAAYEVIAGRG